MLGHKTSLSIFKEIEIMSSMFSELSGMKLGINDKRKPKKPHKHMLLDGE